jgi:transcriptional regulator with PAS, ATPase and Fis domain
MNLDPRIKEKGILRLVGKEPQGSDRSLPDSSAGIAGRIIGKSEPMRRVFRLIEKVAGSDSTLLITGESGTGKELVAKTVHANSPRREKPFVPVHCGAIPEGLLESELFGHEKGAFTGATSSRMGKFELAHGGTIFLDEVAAMSPALQAKILRVLQERAFERLGGTETLRVDVRVVAATGEDLEEGVAKKRFREDLFYRLNVIPIALPPLRERTEDLPLLIDAFLSELDPEGRIAGVSPEAIQRLFAYHWPGNVRELENLIERLVILKGAGAIQPSDLPEKMKRGIIDFSAKGIDFPEEGIDFTRLVEEFENRLILEALRRSRGAKSRAARLLRLNRTTLVEKIKRKGLLSGPESSVPDGASSLMGGRNSA